MVYDKEYRANMKMAKSYKIVILFTMLIASLVMAFSMMNFGVAKALTAPTSASSYIDGVESGSANINEQNSTLDISLSKDSNKFGFKSKLVIEDFEISFDIDGEYTSVSLDLTYDSYLENGVLKVKNAETGEKELVKTIENSIVIEKAGKAYFAKQENADKKDVALTDGIKIELSVENGFLVASVNGVELTTQTDKYYKIGFMDKPVAEVDLVVNTENDVTVALDYVDQKASDNTGAYKQTFALTNGELTNALPRVTLNDSFFTSKNAIIKDVSTQYTLTLAPYSVLNNVKSSDVYLARPENSNIWLAVDTQKPKKVMFPAVSASEDFYVAVDGIKDAYAETYTVKVQDPENTTDNVAPKYKKGDADFAESLASFKQAIIDATMDDGHYIALGTEFEIPSMKDLVADETTAYEDLSIKVYYKSATQSRTASELSFKIDEAGDYTFYVVFTDAAGNALEVDSIVEEDDNGELTIKDADLVFKFYIADDAPIEVEAPTNISGGFIDVKYTLSSFKVEASGCKVTYKLYYNANKAVEITSVEDLTAENGWVEIPTASSISDKNYNKNGYDYDDIKNIGYDGKVTFTPDKIGSYVVECYAVSEVTHRSETDFAVIRVADKPVEVKVPSNWLQNNVWSVVFLSVGTLCLIGIIVLLFIKPKDETESD